MYDRIDGSVRKKMHGKRLVVLCYPISKIRCDGTKCGRKLFDEGNMENPFET